MSSPTLFDLYEPPPMRELLAGKLSSLAGNEIFIGTSSWKYEGWLGQVYTRERYLTGGRFSQRKFNQTCLDEYAEIFPIVCGDFSFYQFPSEDYWQKLFASAPSRLRFAFKVPEEITVRYWPSHPRYGPRAGLENPAFLNSEIFQQMFLELLKPFRSQVDVLIFEFGTFPKSLYAEPAAFLADLDVFLAALPREWRYAVEVRNREFLDPDYFACLRSHGVAHVFNAWTRMPELSTQLAIPGVFTAPFTVTRALLSFGRSYEQAVERFQPYSRIQEINAAGRQALRSIIDQARWNRQAAYVFVNNRFEGNAPATIAAIVADPD